MKSDKNLDEDELWKKEIPYDTRQLAIKELISAYKSNFAKGDQFEMKFKSKRKCSAIFHVDKNALTKNFVIFSRRLPKQRLRTKKRDRNCLKNKEWGDFQILRDKTNKWYLIIPFINNKDIEGRKRKKKKKTKEELEKLGKKERKKIQKEEKKRKEKLESEKLERIKATERELTDLNNNKEIMVALDPGVRTFQTFYSHNKCGKLGDGINEILKKYYSRIDKLTSLSQTKEYSKTRCNIRQRCNLLRAKVKNKVRELHWKSAHFLCSNYKVILLPTFGTQDMIKKTRRKIGKKAARNLLTLSHYRFKQRLKEKAKEFGSIVIEVNEAYTSQTCSNCGVNKKIKGAEIYSCDKCLMVADRDINAAKNIYNRYLTKLYKSFLVKK